MKCILSLLLVLLFLVSGVISVSAAEVKETGQKAAQKPEPAKVPQKDYQPFSLGELYVTGDKLPVAQEVTQITEITAEDITATNSKTVSEALSHVAGVLVTTGRKDVPKLSIHGINQDKILVLIDGVPYYETNYGSLDLNSIPTDNIARIEVQKGVSSVLYGPNGLAGIINIITKKATERPAIGALLEAGDYESRRFTFWHGMKVKKMNYWISYDHQERSGWLMSRDYEPRSTRVNYRNPASNPSYVLEGGGKRNNSYTTMDGIWAKFGIEPTTGSEYFINFHYIEKTRGGPASIMDDQNRINLRRPAFSQFWQFPKFDNWGIDLSGQQQFGSRVTVKGKLFYHNHVDELESYRDPGYSVYLSTSRYKDDMFGGSLSSDIKLAEIDTLKLALHYRRDKHEERNDTYLPFQEAASYTGSFGVENELKPTKNLSIVGGLSYDWFDVTKSTQNETNNAGDLTGVKGLKKPDDNMLSPMLGATYTFSDGTKVFASWARKVRFPTLSTLYSSTSGNPDLRPEKSMNYVLGASRNITQYARGEASFFVHDVKDFISRDGSSTTALYINYGKIFMYGVEFSTEVFPCKDLTIKASYTYNNATDKSPGSLTDRVTFVPTHKADFSVKYLIPWITTKIDLIGTYVGYLWGQLPTPSNPTTSADGTSGYFTADIRLSKNIYKNLEAYFVVKNIFDKNYEQELGFPAPGRNMFIGMKASY
ncbi:MAG: Vitamin B12 transporter BtuB [Syntrophorhabdaceae bacterium]|nr:Vitamin B12 transporter BtuB [Syntrophorhabdaceae bacterium]HNQ63143.1 TonB-dependent receptor [Syntrophorhabdaceae bacterium]